MSNAARRIHQSPLFQLVDVRGQNRFKKKCPVRGEGGQLSENVSSIEHAESGDIPPSCPILAAKHVAQDLQAKDAQRSKGEMVDRGIEAVQNI